MKRRFLVLAFLLLAAWGVSAQQILVEYSGTVTAVSGVPEGPLAAVQVGDPVTGVAVFAPSVFPAGSGDGATWQYVRAPWTDSLDLLRSRVVIGSQVIDTDEYAFHLGTAGLDNAHFPTIPPGPLLDRFFVNDWSSPLNAGDPAVTVAPMRIVSISATAPGSSDFVTAPIPDLYAPIDFSLATALVGSVTDGMGKRYGPNIWGFDTNDPPFDPSLHAMTVEFTIDHLAKTTCQNRVVWVEFGWAWPTYPLTCAESQRN